MAIAVQIPSPLRIHTQGHDTVLGQGQTVGQVLDDVTRQFPELRQRLFDGNQIRRFVNVYLNDEDIRFLDNLDTPVKDGDQISIIPAVAGG
ncbi:MAG: MoaD family protein [Gemmatales bacterium]|nr:MoaD family protein [Gemmatales bacterium]MDW8223998.1 ubiquitin-like small modifier protein 1 [Gemmatales bacterium]